MNWNIYLIGDKMIENDLNKAISDTIKCVDCIYKFECLAKHHIPENFGKNCKKYEKKE